MSEEAIYGLILVSGMIVVSYDLDRHVPQCPGHRRGHGVVFFAAHVYAGTLAASRRPPTARPDFLRASEPPSATRSGCCSSRSLPIAVLLLGRDDGGRTTTSPSGSRCIIDTVALGILGWLAVAKWTHHWWLRLASALLTAAFGGVIILLKAFIHH